MHGRSREFNAQVNFNERAQAAFSGDQTPLSNSTRSSCTSACSLVLFHPVVLLLNLAVLVGLIKELVLLNHRQPMGASRPTLVREALLPPGLSTRGNNGLAVVPRATSIPT
jgi:hypothetical protein